MSVEEQETYEVLEALLKDESNFLEVAKMVFASIDTDNSGTLEKPEMIAFLNQTCGETGIKKLPDMESIEKVFKDIDTDKSNDINMAELSAFLKRVFTQQLRQLGKRLGK